MMNEVFLAHASAIVADTVEGLSGSVIAERCAAFAVEYDVSIPYGSYPFGPEHGNKRTALARNLGAFSAEQQYTILMSLCNHPHLAGNQNVKKLKVTLYTRYRHLATDRDAEVLNLELVEETQHWLTPFKGAHKIFIEAISKYKSNVLQRNLLDDYRLALELLCKELLGNDKSLENQAGPLGEYIKISGGSKEVRNMFQKLIEYYGKYQNEYVKHSDTVVEAEITFVVELTCTFIKYLLQIEGNHA